MAGEEVAAFIGLGTFAIQMMACVLIGIFIWALFQIYRPIKRMSDLEDKYTGTEEVLLSKSLAKKGINLDVEMAKMDEIKRPQTIRSLVRSQIKKDFFNEQKDNK